MQNLYILSVSTLIIKRISTEEDRLFKDLVSLKDAGLLQITELIDAKRIRITTKLLTHFIRPINCIILTWLIRTYAFREGS